MIVHRFEGFKGFKRFEVVICVGLLRGPRVPADARPHVSVRERVGDLLRASGAGVEREGERGDEDMGIHASKDEGPSRIGSAPRLPDIGVRDVEKEQRLVEGRAVADVLKEHGEICA